MDDDERRTRGDDSAEDADREAPAPGETPVRPPVVPGDEVRVVAVEAAVAAGLVPESRHPFPDDVGAQRQSGPLEAGEGTPYELPDWTAPPTGQVPSVLRGDSDAPGALERGVHGPTWRQTPADWDEDESGLEYLSEDPDAAGEVGDELSVIAGRGEDPTAIAGPFEFEFDFDAPTTRRRLRERQIAASAAVTVPGDSGLADDAAWEQVVGASRNRRRPRAAHRAGWRLAEPPPENPPRRNTAIAAATGIVLAGVAVLCFANGPLPALVLAAVVLGVAAGETFGAVRLSGYQPAALVGLVAVPVLVVASYLKGPEAVPVVVALVVILAGASRIVMAPGDSPVDDLAVTMLVVTWVGVLGSFAGLLLNPTAYPLRHGVAYLGAAVALTVAHDVGSFAVGSKLGRHRLAPRVSPGKTIEGLIGGTVLTLGLAAGVVARVHPFGIGTALALGAVVVVFAPIGDLFESVVKRDLGLKDMGRLLPAHGGVFDRIDAMLFVLPATYLLVRLVHIG
ncbi:MAG: phosphatidate cytidylyltransferase [Acidimicrobiales bacterium]